MKKILITLFFLIFFNFGSFSLGKVLTPIEKQEYDAIKMQLRRHVDAVGPNKANDEYIFQYLKNMGTSLALRLSEDIKKIDNLVKEGNDLLVNKKYNESINKFDEAIIIDEDWVAFDKRAQAYFELGNIIQALNDISKAINIAPNVGRLYTFRGLCYHKLGNDNASYNDLVIAGNLGDLDAQEIIKVTNARIFKAAHK